MHAIMCYIDIVYSYSMTCAQYLHHSCSGFSHSQTIETRHSRLQWEIFHLSKLAIFELLQQTSGQCGHAALQQPAHKFHLSLLGLKLKWKGGDIQIFFQYSNWMFLFDVRIISSEVNYVTRGHPNLWFMNIRKAALYSALHSHARAQSCCPAPAAARPVCKVILASNLHNMRLPAQCCHDH